jgi:AmiR/NasT family two-component response regulator
MSNQESVRVLIAENRYLISEMLKGLLEEIGYTVVGEAADGLEAVEMTQSLRPDVVLMEIDLPDMGGIEATRRISECCPTPVVALIVYETPELVKEASEAGVGAFLDKPPTPREMEQAIATAMARFDNT